jgi:GNAT superfamily N-acetyltransferase
MFPHEIAKLEEARIARSIAELSDAHLAIGGGVAGYGGSPESWINQVVGVGMDGRVEDEALDALVDFYAARGVEPEVDVCPYADLSFARGLSERGFALTGFETVLARELTARPEVVVPDGVTLERVDPDDEASLETFIAAHLAGFAPEGAAHAAATAEGARRMVRHPKVTSWVVRVDGELAAAGGLELRPPIACLIAVGVLAPFRRRGLQSMLIQHRCALARDAGCRVATIGSAPESATERNALRAGFTTAYTKAKLSPASDGARELAGDG